MFAEADVVGRMSPGEFMLFCVAGAWLLAVVVMGVTKHLREKRATRRAQLPVTWVYGDHRDLPIVRARKTWRR